MKRPTQIPHFNSIPPLTLLTASFAVAYSKVGSSSAYTTISGTSFTAHASQVTKGAKKGTEVIIFKRNGRESARAYQCCWGHITNCNRTYIDSYTEVI